MAGYADDYSMSNNAVAAYDSGLVPASKIKGVPAHLIRQFVEPAEWHHTSSRYNSTNFFNTIEVQAAFGLEPSDDYEVNPEAVTALAAWKFGQKSDGIIHENCKVEWLEWAGTRNHPKATRQTADGCTVSVKGQTATITLPDGKSFVKRLKTNGFSFRVVAEIHLAAV